MDFLSSVYNAAARGVRAARGDPEYLSPKLALSELTEISTSIEERNSAFDRELFKRIDKLLWVLTSVGATQLDICAYLQIDRIFSFSHEVYRSTYNHSLNDQGELAARPNGLQDRELITDVVRRCRALKLGLLKPVIPPPIDDATEDELDRTRRTALAAMRRIEELQGMLEARSNDAFTPEEVEAVKRQAQEKIRRLQDQCTALKDENGELQTKVADLQQRVDLQADRLVQLEARSPGETSQTPPPEWIEPAPRVDHHEIAHLRAENKQLAESLECERMQVTEALGVLERARSRQVDAERQLAAAREELEGILAERTDEFAHAQEVATAYESIGLLPKGAIRFTGDRARNHQTLNKMFGLIGTASLGKTL